MGISLASALLVSVAACSRGSNTETDSSSAPGSSAPTSGAPTNGQFGTITTPVCGPAPGATSDTGTPGTGANVLGVSQDSIRLGVISDVGYAGAPGLNQELFDASDVFASWCNSLGGINGHKIVIDKLDAKITDYQSVIQKACEQDFALVGGGGAFDDTGQSARLSCLLPDFPGYVVTPAARGADLQVQAVNTSSDTRLNFGLARYLNATFPDAKDAVGYLTANFATTINLKKQYQDAGAQNGWSTVYDEQYNAVGESTWVPFAQGLADKKAKGLVWIGEPTGLGKLLGALDQIGYELDWVAGPGNVYDTSLIATAGGALDTNNVYIDSAITPFEATDIPAIPQYEQLFDTYLPHGKKNAALGLQSFSAWLLFAQSAKACGANITRSCVLGHATSTTSWAGGGLSGEVNPSTPEDPSQCYAGIKATSKGFTILDWETDSSGVYNCNPANVVTLTDTYGPPAKLSDVGKSLADLK
ncbi:MAG: ABC transporter substrate-binding protein [Acidimicrobiales bacterium]